jgi:hypothetical protein
MHSFEPLFANKLAVPADSVDSNLLLASWRWLVPHSMQILVITAIGDLFLHDLDGTVHRLDTGRGELTKIAKSIEQFEELLKNKLLQELWLQPQMIKALNDRGSPLQPGECYSCKHPACLGGATTLENFEPTELLVHFSIFGQIHNHIKLGR